LGATKQWWSYSDVMAGISTESESEGGQVTGPTFAAQIPVFNYGQAARRRLLAQYQQSKEDLRALEVSTLCQVRTALQQLHTIRNLVIAYREQLVPLQRNILSSAVALYNVMGLGVYKLLEAKKQQIETEIDAMMTLADYWIARVDLDRALGGKLHLVTQASLGGKQ